jgi:hypothetical protein
VLVRAKVPVAELHRFDDLRTNRNGARVPSQGEGGTAGGLGSVLDPHPPTPPARASQ